MVEKALPQSEDKEIIFQDENYLVSSHIVNRNSLFVVAFSPWNKKFHHEITGRFTRDFGREAICSIELNAINVITSRNDWYSGASIDNALNHCRRLIGNSRCITYGSSMGGHAAIKFAGQLNAKLFIAISPQYSISEKFLNEISDARWKAESSYLSERPESSLTVPAGRTPGLIIYDKLHLLDAKHASRCAQDDQIVGVNLEHSGHPAGEAANASYGLKKLLAKVAKCAEMDAMDVVSELKSIAAEIEACYKTSGRYKFATSTSSYDATLSYASFNSGKLPLHLVRNYFSNYHPDLAGILLGMVIISRNEDLLRSRPKIFQNLTHRLIKSANNLGLDVRKTLGKISASPENNTYEE